MEPNRGGRLGSEMDRHSPTGPCLCCQRSVDYMTEGGTRGEAVAGGYRGLYGGIHPKERIAFTPKVPLSSHKSILCTVTFVQYANQPAVGSACCCDAQHRVVRLLLLTVITFIIPNDLGAAVFLLSLLTMIRWPFPSRSSR